MTTKERQPPAAILVSEEWEKELLRMNDLLSEQDIEGARALIRELREQWPDSERVRRYDEILNPGPARVLHGQRSGRPWGRARDWLKIHAQEYPGCWLAVHEEGLIAAAPQL